MKKFLLMGLLARPVFALAPAPINFTREEVVVDGKKYEVTFDGDKLEIEEEPTTLRPEIVFFLFVGGIVFWIWFIGYVTGWW